jgi:hypothetical protein
MFAVAGISVLPNHANAAPQMATTQSTDFVSDNYE